MERARRLRKGIEFDTVYQKGTVVSGPLLVVRHMANGEWQPGPDPNRAPYGSFADFKDPDGNTWVLQEVNRGESAS